MDLSLAAVTARLRDPASLAGTLDTEPPRKFRAAAVIIPLVAREVGLTVIFNKRASHLQTHAGQVSFPGGRRDPDDATLLATAQREMTEELGIAPPQHQVLCRLSPRLVISYYEVTPFVSLIEPSAALRPDPGEVAYAFEVPLAHFMTAGTETAMARDVFGEMRWLYAWQWQGERIWGATGRFMADVIRALGAEHVAA